jgi:hypothetical protein
LHLYEKFLSYQLNFQLEGVRRFALIPPEKRFTSFGEPSNSLIFSILEYGRAFTLRGFEPGSVYRFCLKTLACELEFFLTQSMDFYGGEKLKYHYR